MKCKSDRQDIKLRKRHKRVERKWQKLKPECECCPDCFEKVFGLNDSLFHRIKRFSVECENCHWVGKSMPTIKLAVRAWNKQENPSKQIYND